MISSRKFRTAALLLVFLYTSSTSVFAENLRGKIQSLKPLQNGQVEVVVADGGQKHSVLLNSSTLVQSVIAAKQVKKGASVSITQSRRGGGEQKGFKSPFRGIPKNMRKSMGLPEIAETPDIPGQPKEAEVPVAPKVPKTPKLGQKGGDAAPASEEGQPEGQGQGGGRKSAEPPEHKLTDEEKSLFGKADANKPLLNSSGETEENPAKEVIAGTVLGVKTTKKGISLEIQGASGEKQELVLSPNRSVTQILSAEALREEMTIFAETAKSKEKNVAQKITVIQ